MTDEFDNQKVYNELDWNSTSSLERNPYAYSKTCAERAAWEFMEKMYEGTGLRRVQSSFGSAGGFAERNSTTQHTYVDPDIHLTDFVNKHMRLITILPGMLLGPHLGGRVNYSHRHLLVYLENRLRGVLNVSLPIADVRDVASCHILAMESGRSESTRYCLTNKAVHMLSILQTIHENFVDIKLPLRKVRDTLSHGRCVSRRRCD